MAPKFPSPHNLLLLLYYARLENEPAALHMAETTLKAMAAGGLFDHIGGGFSRYATDDKWLIPHFEKMLYDNTLLLIAYLSAYQFTGDAFYAEVARRTADYMLRNFIRRKAAFSAARTRTVTAWRKVLHVYRKKSGVCWVRRTRRRFAVFTGSHRPETLKAQAFRNRIGVTEPAWDGGDPRLLRLY